jgi:hypothetical protein
LNLRIGLSKIASDLRDAAVAFKVCLCWLRPAFRYPSQAACLSPPVTSARQQNGCCAYNSDTAN